MVRGCLLEKCVVWWVNSMDLRVLGSVPCCMQIVAGLLTMGPPGQQSWFHGHTASAVQLCRALCAEGSVLALMLCCCRLEILSTFWTRSPAFSFVTGPVS